MALKTVQAVINGQTYNLTLNSGTGKYEATITAPANSSYTQDDHYYPITLKATDMAGNVAYMSKALFTVDVNSIHIHLLKDIFELDSQDNNDIKMTASYAEDFECSVKEVLPCIANV